MANSAPGVNVSVTVASPNSKGVNPTGTWFVLGNLNGPSGVAVPINSIDDLATYFGVKVGSSVSARYTGVGTNSVIDNTLTFDALDVFFREGGINTFVSNVVSSSAVKATSTLGLLGFTAAGGGSWANSTSSDDKLGLVLNIVANSDGSFTTTVNYNGNALATSPSLADESSIAAWINTLPLYKGMCTAVAGTKLTSTTTASGSGATTSIAIADVTNWASSGYVSIAATTTGSVATTLVFKYTGITAGTSPAGTLTGLTLVNGAASSTFTNGAAVSNRGLPASGSSMKVYFTSGADAATNATDISTAMTFFVDILGPGQISHPGNTTPAVWKALAAHAISFNRVALVDAGTATASASTLASNVAAIQPNGAQAATDASYIAAFAPWVVAPGIVNATNTVSNAGSFNRTVPPVALAAARMANNDQYNDCNVPAAGVGAGSASYCVAVSNSFSDADRATLNAAGVNVIRNLPNVNQIVLYGYRSASTDMNWVYLNNVRFRMQVKREFDLIAESFIFDEIDGRGQIFARLNGALAGQCQSYWTRHSIYGVNASDAFQVNTGTLVNTPDTIAAGQINAVVNLRMAPFGEFVTVNVNKYLPNQALPNYSTQYTL
mgnify:CR=1 FL=1